ncbi:MAG: energy transducer TonB family protein, partial [Terriglobales bacterium]
VWLGSRLLKRRPDSQPASSVSSSPPAVSEAAAAPESQGAAPEAEAAATDAAKPSAIKKRSEHSSPQAAAPPSAPAVASRPTSGAGSDQGSVLQQVSPVVSKSAQNSISGTIRIRVKVLVDASGNVENASFISAGPSKYFSRQSMQAAQQWKFSPAQSAARAWILHFGFRRSGVEVASEPAKP